MLTPIAFFFKFCSKRILLPVSVSSACAGASIEVENKSLLLFKTSFVAIYFKMLLMLVACVFAVCISAVTSSRVVVHPIAEN